MIPVLSTTYSIFDINALLVAVKNIQLPENLPYSSGFCRGGGGGFKICRLAFWRSASCFNNTDNVSSSVCLSRLEAFNATSAFAQSKVSLMDGYLRMSALRNLCTKSTACCASLGFKLGTFKRTTASSSCKLG